MVKIHVTNSMNEFVFECKTSDSVDDVTAACARILNLRNRVSRLVHGARELAKYGPAREEKDRGLTQAQVAGGVEADPNADPLGIRVGVPPAAAAAETLLRTASELEALIDPNLTKRRRATDEKAIHATIELLEGAVTICYPMGLPEWDTVRHGLEDNEDLSGSQDSKYVYDPETCGLWFAGKLMQRGEILSKYVGNNEKCIVKGKLQKNNAQAPQREPPMDDETRKKMYAFWHKKQNQAKALEGDDENSYLDSAWANPNGMRNQLHGMDSISWRPGRR